MRSTVFFVAVIVGQQALALNPYCEILSSPKDNCRRQVSMSTTQSQVDSTITQDQLKSKLEAELNISQALLEKEDARPLGAESTFNDKTETITFKACAHTLSINVDRIAGIQEDGKDGLLAEIKEENADLQRIYGDLLILQANRNDRCGSIDL